MEIPERCDLVIFSHKGDLILGLGRFDLQQIAKVYPSILQGKFYLLSELGYMLIRKMKIEKEIPQEILEKAKVGLIQDGNVIIDHAEWERNYALPCGIHVTWPAVIPPYAHHL